MRTRFISTLSSLAAAAALLAACGGGGDSTPPPASAAKLDIDGTWVAQPSASPDSGGLMLTAGRVAYGYEYNGTAIRFFSASDYVPDVSAYAFQKAMYDEYNQTTGAYVDTVNGSLSGDVVTTASPRQLHVAFGVPAGTTSRFQTMTLVPAVDSLNVMADLRDYAGTYATSGTGSLTLTAGSSTTATLSAVNLYGCNVTGTMTLPRADRNVWDVTLNQSNCTDARRNGLATKALAVPNKAGTKTNLLLLGTDGWVWTLVASSL